MFNVVIYVAQKNIIPNSKFIKSVFYVIKCTSSLYFFQAFVLRNVMLKIFNVY
jgi:hypothetical protein